MTEITDEMITKWLEWWLPKSIEKPVLLALLQSHKDNTALTEKLRLAEEDAERLLPFTQHGTDCNTRLDNECNCGLTHAKWQRLDHIKGGVA